MHKLSNLLSTTTCMSTVFFFWSRCFRLPSPSRSSVWFISIVVEKFFSCTNSFFCKYANTVIPCNHYDLLQRFKILSGSNMSEMHCYSISSHIIKPNGQVNISNIPWTTFVFGQYLCIAIWIWWVVGKLQFITLPVSIKNKLQNIIFKSWARKKLNLRAKSNVIQEVMPDHSG